jgi:hypothetical protein
MTSKSEPYKYIECPGCDAKFTVDDRLECVFADTSDLRLPIKGNICSNCGLLQDYGVDKCRYCGKEMSSTIQ